MRAQDESVIQGFRPIGGLPITISPVARYTSFTAFQFQFGWKASKVVYVLIITLDKQCRCCHQFHTTSEVSGSSTLHFIWLLDCCSSQPQHCYHQVMMPKIINIGHLPVMYIFKATSKSPQDSQVIDLVSESARRVLPGHFIKRTVLACCSANNQMMGAAEIHKTAAFIISDTYTMPGHNIFHT